MFWFTQFILCKVCYRQIFWGALIMSGDKNFKEFENLEASLKNCVKQYKTTSYSIFNSLKLWQDINGDGITENGELISLSDAGIKSISLNTTSTNINQEPLSVLHMPVHWHCWVAVKAKNARARCSGYYGQDACVTMVIFEECRILYNINKLSYNE